MATLAKNVIVTIAPGTQSDPGGIFYDVKISIPKVLNKEETDLFEKLSRVSDINPRD